jgi:hypothetical protein
MQTNMSGVTGGGINDIFEILPSLIQQSTDNMKQNIQDMRSTMAGNHGMLDPIQMQQLQMMSQVYSAIVQTFSSLVKEVGTIEKSIANAIGN